MQVNVPHCERVLLDEHSLSLDHVHRILLSDQVKLGLLSVYSLLLLRARLQILNKLVLVPIQLSQERSVTGVHLENNSGVLLELLLKMAIV